MDELEKNKNKRKIYISLLVTVLCIIGVSYAFFTIYLRQTDNNSVMALSCFTSTLTEENSALNLENEFPISDENGMKKTPFTFKVTNNCDNYVKIYITIDPLNEGTANYIPSKYIKANVSSKDTTDGESLIVGNQSTKVLDNKDNGFILKEVTLAPNGSKEFDLRLWIDYDTTKEQAAGMTYTSQVVIVTEPGKEPTFTDIILANNEVKSPITTPGAAVSTSDESLLASTEDDYGTSYYFRGNVKNNYVEFANKCWRVVRITGDGSVKLVLHNDNTSKAASPCAEANNDENAAFAHFNTAYTDYRSYSSEFNSNYDDNAYVGFMYGTAGSTNYASTHANTNKSTILTNLDAWYANNLASYEDKITDTVWCCDKTNVADTTFNPWNINNVSGLGYAKNVTYYGTTQRLINSDKKAGGTGPSLKCKGELSKIITKVGLLSADELTFAGYAYNALSAITYLQENSTGSYWWSLSPSYFDGDNAVILGIVGVHSNVYNDSFMSGDRVYRGDAGVRPSISLVSSTTISGGSGTSEDPYIVD